MDTHPADVLPDLVRSGEGDTLNEQEHAETDDSTLEPVEARGHMPVPTDLIASWRAAEGGADDIVFLPVSGSMLPPEVHRAARLSQLAVLKADFTAMVAHELLSPIVAIRTLTAMLAIGELSPEEQRQVLSTISAQTNVLQALVTDLEAAAAAERDDFAVQLHPVPVVELLVEAAAFNSTLPGEHPMTTLAAVPDQVLADRERIGQVLRNLIQNAAKYSPIGAPIELRATSRGGWVRFEVADRGRGIAPHEQRRIFEKFGRGRDERGQRVPGVGLGLYLSRRLVQMHGSKLTVEPRPGGGSTFAFALERLP